MSRKIMNILYINITENTNKQRTCMGQGALSVLLDVRPYDVF